MKKILYCILLIIASFCNVKTQTKDLFLIQAHVFDDLGGMFQFNSYIYKLHSNMLDTITEISTEKEFLYAVKVYPDFNKAFLYKDGWLKSKEKYIGILDFNSPGQISWKNVNYENYKIIDGNLISTKDKYFVLDLYGRKETPKNVFFGINIDKLKEETTDPSIYKSVILNGSAGGVMQGKDFLTVYTNPDDGKLFIPKTSKIEERPVFPIEIPDSLQLKEKKRILILINNKASFVIAKEESEPDSKNIGHSIIIINDKVSDQWYSYKIKGNRQVIRGFGGWLAGTVVDDNIKLIMDESGAIKDKEVFTRISPGKEERKKKDSENGTAFDQRADYIGTYYSGILYLLNTKTKNYIEWNTGQGDSEILLVQDGIVYYRVADKIFKAIIIEGKSIGKPELIIQDERVHDIHWAFISEN